MNLGELKARYRAEAGDTVPPYFIDDVELERLLNEAVAEACLRSDLILDSATEEVCQIATVVGQAWYPLHPSIIRIHPESRFENDNLPLQQRSIADLRIGNANWTQETGRPDRYARDRQMICLVPKPNLVGTVNLWVYRRPLDTEQMVDLADEPVIDLGYHADLVHWVKFRAYSRVDSELFNPKGAAEAETLFAARFGLRPSAKALGTMQRQPYGRAAYARAFGG